MRRSTRRTNNYCSLFNIYSFYGPNRVPLTADFRSMLPSGYRPFHGIISRGLLKALQTAGKSIDWNECCVWLDPALVDEGLIAEQVPGDLLDLARCCHVLRFEESAAAAKNFICEHIRMVLECLGAAFGPDQLKWVELWNVKEGHIASVWKVSVFPVHRRDPVSFALNVARDVVAGEELLSSASILKSIERRILSVNTARVLTKARVQVFDGDMPDIPVIAQEWIADALELAYLKDRRTGRRRLFAIERFLTAPEVPSRIVSAVGRRLTQREQDRLIFEMLFAMLEGSTFDVPRDRVAIPCFEINEGDWVLSGEHVNLVAVSAEYKQLSLGEALGYYQFHLPMKYGVSDAEGREALLRLARQAVHNFCSRGDTINLANWVDRARLVSEKQWLKLKCADDIEIILDSLIKQKGIGNN